MGLFVDTHYPAFHIYRESDLARVAAFKQSKKTSGPRITLSMIVKNEANRYLRQVLQSAKEYISDAVIIDDGSTDNTVAVCKEVLKNLPLRIVQNAESKFSNEVDLRKQQWEETVKSNPEWILMLDADEIFEDRFKDDIKPFLASTNADAVLFRLYDFWDPDHYRDDVYWSAHRRFALFLVRYNPNIDYAWKDTPQHCGRFPLNAYRFNAVSSMLRLKHFGWASIDARISKYERYQKLDPEAKYGWKEQYESILDKNPHLVQWIE